MFNDCTDAGYCVIKWQLKRLGHEKNSQETASYYHAVHSEVKGTGNEDVG